MSKRSDRSSAFRERERSDGKRDVLFNRPGDGSAHGHVVDSTNDEGDTEYHYVRDEDGRVFVDDARAARRADRMREIMEDLRPYLASDGQLPSRAELQAMVTSGRLSTSDVSRLTRLAIEYALLCHDTGTSEQ